jgi:hypothetical protein
VTSDRPRRTLRDETTDATPDKSTGIQVVRDFRAHRLHRSIRVHRGVRALTTTMRVGCSALLDSGVRWWISWPLRRTFVCAKHSRTLMDQSFGPLDHRKDRSVVTSTEADLVF